MESTRKGEPILNQVQMRSNPNLAWSRRSNYPAFYCILVSSKIHVQPANEIERRPFHKKPLKLQGVSLSYRARSWEISRRRLTGTWNACKRNAEAQVISGGGNLSGSWWKQRRMSLLMRAHRNLNNGFASQLKQPPLTRVRFQPLSLSLPLCVSPFRGLIPCAPSRELSSFPFDP